MSRKGGETWAHPQFSRTLEGLRHPKSKPQPARPKLYRQVRGLNILRLPQLFHNTIPPKPLWEARFRRPIRLSTFFLRTVCALHGEVWHKPL